MTQETQHSFRKYCTEKVLPVALRRNSVWRSANYKILLAVVVSILLFVLIFSFIRPKYVAIYSKIVGVGLLGFVAFSVFKVFKKLEMIQHEAHVALFNFFGNNATYSRTQAKTEEDWLSSWKQYEISFDSEQLSVANLYQLKGMGRNRYYQENGILVEWKHDIPIFMEMFVLKDQLEKYTGKVGVFAQKMDLAKPKLVHFGASKFEDLFRVYSNDEATTRAILHPESRQKLEEWSAASKIQFWVSHSTIKVHYFTERSMLPMKATSLDYTDKRVLDSVFKNYLDAIKIKDIFQQILIAGRANS